MKYLNKAELSEYIKPNFKSDIYEKIMSVQESHNLKIFQNLDPDEIENNTQNLAIAITGLFSDCQSVLFHSNQLTYLDKLPIFIVEKILSVNQLNEPISFNNEGGWLLDIHSNKQKLLLTLATLIMMSLKYWMHCHFLAVNQSDEFLLSIEDGVLSFQGTASTISKKISHVFEKKYDGLNDWYF